MIDLQFKFPEPSRINQGLQTLSRLILFQLTTLQLEPKNTLYSLPRKKQFSAELKILCYRSVLFPHRNLYTAHLSQRYCYVNPTGNIAYAWIFCWISRRGTTNVPEMLKVKDARYFSKMDLYYQIAVPDHLGQYLVLSKTIRHYQFNVLPLGPAYGAISFQGWCNDRFTHSKANASIVSWMASLTFQHSYSRHPYGALRAITSNGTLDRLNTFPLFRN